MTKTHFTLLALAVQALFACPAFCSADTINGFSTFTTNANTEAAAAGLPFINGGLLQLTESNVHNIASSAFSNQTVDISNGFTAEFTLEFGAPPASFHLDGIAFVLHSDPRGSSALGGGGGGKGWRGTGTDQITPALGLEFEPDSGLYRLRHSGGLLGRNYANFGAFEAGGNNSTLVNITFNRAENTLTQTLTSAIGTRTYVNGDFNFSMLSDTVYVGFSGGTGGGTNSGAISNFSFNTTSVPEPAATFPLLLVLAASITKRSRN